MAKSSSIFWLIAVLVSAAIVGLTDGQMMMGRKASRRNNLAYQFADGVETVVGEVKESFTCENRDYGYYADTTNNCQVFHICVPPHQQFSFFCPNTTIFDQKLLVCNDELFATPCQEAEKYYVLNQNFGVTDPDKLVKV